MLLAQDRHAAYHHDVQSGKFGLISAERFANEPFATVAVYCPAQRFARRYDSEARPAALAGECADYEVSPPGDPALLEHRFELLGAG